MTTLTAPDETILTATKPIPIGFTFACRLVGIVLAVSGFVVVLEGIHVALGTNFHPIETGVCYRCGQPSRNDLRNHVHNHGIKTVINLRGPNADKDWYQVEHATAQELGLDIHDRVMASNIAPEPDDFLGLIDLLDQAQKPVLLHCQSGGDRTGLVSAIFVLLQPGSSLDHAKSQISFRYGHKFWSHAIRMRHVLQGYEDWLNEQNTEHSPEQFRRWVKDDYPSLVMPELR